MRLLHWYRRCSRYDRLKQYPELSGFPRGRVRVLVRRYQREERSRPASQIILVVIILAAMLPPAAGIWGDSLFGGNYTTFALIAAVLLMIVPSMFLITWLDSSMRKRVSQRIVDELGGGRLRVCLKCGYDLRGTPGEVCSECGSSVYLAIVRQERGKKRFEGRVMSDE